MTNLNGKKLTALLCTAVIALCAAVPVSAADSMPTSMIPELTIDGAQVEVIHVIDRELRTDYAVTGTNDRAAIVTALNKLDYRPATSVTPDMTNLRLLQIRFKDGQKYQYWCHTNVLMVGEAQITDGASAAALYKAMDNCQENYPANIEWLGYMNPYRVTELAIVGADKATTYASALSATQRDAILDVARKLKSVKVGTIQQLNDKTQNAPAGSTGNLLYTLTLKFETAVETYNVYLFEDGRVTVSVGSINYNLTYLSADKTLYKSLTDTLAGYNK